jgi:hypothetical protein
MEFTKPKYKNLLSYLHDRNHYKDVDKFTDDNKDDILSNFTISPVDKDSDVDGGKCFCGKKLKNVYYVYCILTNEILSVGGNCKTLFSSRKKNKELFINRTIHLFKKGLGFEPIFCWSSFIGKALESWLKTHSLEELEKLKLLYKDYDRTSSVINEYIEKKEKKLKEWEYWKMTQQQEYDWRFNSPKYWQDIKDTQEKIEREEKRKKKIEREREKERERELNKVNFLEWIDFKKTEVYQHYEPLLKHSVLQWIKSPIYKTFLEYRKMNKKFDLSTKIELEC